VQDRDALALPAAEEAEEQLGHALGIGTKAPGLKPARGNGSWYASH
jgi:hypothetical protein